MKNFIFMIILIISISIYAELSITPDWTGTSPLYGGRFGCSVASAGDVNGDGYSDIIIGAKNDANNYEGAAYVYYGSSSGPSSSPQWSRIGENNFASYGASVSSAGDINGDGYSDIIVGSPKYDGSSDRLGKVYIYFGGASGLDTIVDKTITGVQEYAELGNSVSCAGDINNDGYSDIIYGIHDYDDVDKDQGKAVVYIGDIYYSYSRSGAEQYDRYGSYVAGGGDINGDGYSDILVSAQSWGNDNERVEVFLGKSSSGSIFNIVDATLKDTTQTYTNYGKSASIVGDVNGDGYADVLIGAKEEDEDDEGKVYLYYGNSSGISTTPDWTYETARDSALLGFSVSGAGDVNGDGYADIIFGAPYYDNGNIDEGRVYVFLGSASGLSSGADWSVEGNTDSLLLGYSVASAGDVNGDGFSDVIIGAIGYDNGVGNGMDGIVYVYYGSEDGLTSDGGDDVLHKDQSYSALGWDVSTAGDVNGDGYADVIISAYKYDNGQMNEGGAFLYEGNINGLNLTSVWFGDGDLEYAYYGYCISDAGDINGDGYSDVIIGAKYASNGTTDSLGAAYLYLGSSTGLNSSKSWTMYGEHKYDAFGASVSSAGDVNGDGYSDIVIGAPLNNDNGIDAGKVYVYFGCDTGLATSPNWTGMGNQADAQYGRCVSDAGDLNRDGFSDIAIGSWMYSGGTYTENGRIDIYGGDSATLNLVKTVEGNQDSTRFGFSIDNAGDINSDGYSDLVVGAYKYDNGETDEGAIFIYYGNTSYINSNYDLMLDGDQDSAYYGISVSSAGDVNNDGYSDVIVGAYYREYGTLGANEGVSYVYLGSSSGLAISSYWSGDADQDEARYGYSVANAGDINGDGYSDILVGAYRYDNGETDEGEVFVYYGNDGENHKVFVPQQLRSDESTPIVAPLYSESNGSFYIKLTGKTFRGRNKVKLQWEVKPIDQAFNGTNLQESNVWYDTDIDGVDIIEQVSGLTDRTLYKWRVRIKYSALNGMVEPYSRWFYLSENGPNEADVKSGIAFTMTHSINISAAVYKDRIELYWQGNGDKYKIYRNNILLSETEDFKYIDNTPNIGINNYTIEMYRNNVKVQENSVKIQFIKNNKLNGIETIHYSVEGINKRIREDKLTVYSTDGRAIKEIKKSGEYYIIDKQGNEIINKKKIIVIE